MLSFKKKNLVTLKQYKIKYNIGSNKNIYDNKNCINLYVLLATTVMFPSHPKLLSEDYLTVPKFQKCE